MNESELRSVSFDLETNEPIPGAAPEKDKAAAWEEVAAGRFRPRRIRGSCQGRELG